MNMFGELIAAVAGKVIAKVIEQADHSLTAALDAHARRHETADEMAARHRAECAAFELKRVRKEQKQ